jgi:hypothetical protein
MMHEGKEVNAMKSTKVAWAAAVGVVVLWCVLACANLKTPPVRLNWSVEPVPVPAALWTPVPGDRATVQPSAPVPAPGLEG